jgi:hypothetical protein
MGTVRSVAGGYPDAGPRGGSDGGLAQVCKFLGLCASHLHNFVDERWSAGRLADGDELFHIGNSTLAGN